MSKATNVSSRRALLQGAAALSVMAAPMAVTANAMPIADPLLDLEASWKRAVAICDVLDERWREIDATLPDWIHGLPRLVVIDNYRKMNKN